MCWLSQEKSVLGTDALFSSRLVSRYEWEHLIKRQDAKMTKHYMLLEHIKPQNEERKCY